MSAFLALALAIGQAASPAAAPGAAAPATLQARFDAASDAAANGRCKEAVPQFEAIEQNAAARRNGLVAAAVAVRKGRCLVGTDRSDEGEAAIRRGLPTLDAKGADFAVDVREARLALGSAGFYRLDYAAAEREVETVLVSSTGTARIRPLMLLATLRMFDHDGQALKLVGEARTIVAANSDFSKKENAAVQTLYARVLLNEGRAKDAYAELKDGLKKQGGLTNRVGLAEIGTRSDLAIAALLNNDRDNARLYLAYTGAGRMTDGSFGRAAQMDLPPCGETTGLKRDDMAIVEFTLAADGHVGLVSPIYTPGDRDVAIAFARSVASWSWSAEDTAKVPPFYRNAIRVEVRCTTAAAEREGIETPLRTAFTDWLQSKHVPDAAWKDMADARALPLQYAAFAAATGANDKPAALQATMALIGNSVLPRERRPAIATQAVTLARALDAPVAPRAYVALALVPDQAGADERRRTFHTMLSDPAIAGDALAAATLRLMIAQPVYHSSAPADATMLLDAVIAAPDQPDLRPLKTNALLQQANLFAAKGDLAGARAAFDRTGLTQEQCALIGLTPSMRRSGASSDDYPAQALNMGFEGWVNAEFDIAANGTTVSPRAVVSYPPFVFDDAATGIMRGSRYVSSFRPAGGVACAANQQSVVFRK